jgi:hypothetical protein
MTALNRRTTTVVLYQGDDMAKLQELDQACDVALRLATAGTDGPKRIGDGTDLSDAQAKAEARDKFAESVIEHATIVELGGLPRHTWRDLKKKHPPKADDQTDAAYGFDKDGLGDELVPLSVVSVDPVVQPGDLAAFLDGLTEAQFDNLFHSAYDLNVNQGTDPKASVVSVLTLLRDETPK